MICVINRVAAVIQAVLEQTQTIVLSIERFSCARQLDGDGARSWRWRVDEIGTPSSLLRTLWLACTISLQANFLGAQAMLPDVVTQADRKLCGSLVFHPNR
jgi:hypothetical protein